MKGKRRIGWEKREVRGDVVRSEVSGEGKVMHTSSAVLSLPWSFRV